MKIKIIDNDQSRKPSHRELKKKVADIHTIEIISQIYNNAYKTIDCDLMFMHASNPEASNIEEYSEAKYTRALFSGSFPRGIDGEDGVYYIGCDEDYSFITYFETLINTKLNNK